MKSFQNKTKPPYSKEEYDAFAEEAIDYACSIAKESHTSPSEKEIKKILDIRARVRAARARKSTLSEKVHHLLMYPNNAAWQQTKKVVRNAKEFKVGNCGERSHLVINYLRKKNVERAENVSIVNGDHRFVILNRNKNSDLNDPTTWGGNCTIIDAEYKEKYNAAEIYTRLKKYKFDLTKNDPHVLSPFTPQDKLNVKGCIERQISPEENRKYFNNYLKKINIMQEVCKTHIKHDELTLHNKLDSLNIHLDENQLNTFSNFDLERMCDKKIKKLCKYIAKLPDKKTSEEILMDIAIRTASTHLSYFDYFETLCQVNIVKDVLERIYSRKEPEPSSNIIDFLSKQANTDTLLELMIKYKNKDGIYFCLNNHASPTVTDNKGRTALHLAAYNNLFDMVEVLLNHEANHHLKDTLIDKKNKDGDTALHLAATKGHLKIVEALLKAGANPEIKNCNNEQAIDIARRNNNDELKKILIQNNFSAKVSNSSVFSTTANSSANNDVDFLSSKIRVANQTNQ